MTALLLRRVARSLAAALGATTIITLAAPGSGAGVVRTYDRYAILTATGQLATFGQAGFHGDWNGLYLRDAFVGAAASANGRGYWMVDGDGDLGVYGDARRRGSTTAVVAMAADDHTGGYWELTPDGQLVAYGARRFTLDVPPGAGRVTALAANRAGTGLLVGTQRGDVIGLGTFAHRALRHTHGPVDAIAISPDNHGYWLLEFDGTVVPGGGARTFALRTRHLARSGPDSVRSPATSLAVTPDGRGYWILRVDGVVEAFGDAASSGDLANYLSPPDYPAFYSLHPANAVTLMALAPGPQSSPEGAERVTVIGDSLSVQVAQYTANSLFDHHVAMDIGDGGIMGCGLVGSLDLANWSTGRAPRPTVPACGLWATHYRQELALSHPNVVVFTSGFWESQRIGLPGQATPVTLATSAAYRAIITRHLHTVIALTKAAGAQLVITTSPYYGDGTPDADVNVYNSMVRAVAQRRGAVIYNLNRVLDPNGVYAEVVNDLFDRTTDHVHLTQIAVSHIIDPSLVPLLQTLYLPHNS